MSLTLSEIAADVTDKLNKSDSTSVALAKRFARRRYEMIYHAGLWKDTLVLATKAATTNILTLPLEIEHVVAVRWNEQEVFPVDQQLLFRVDPNIFERSGTPILYTEQTPVGVLTQPADELMRFVSSSASDTSKSVVIRGELNGAEQVETVTLNGAVNVNTTKSWDVIYTLAKDVTTGTVTVTGVTSSATLVELWDVERERKYVRIRLLDSPSDTSKSLLVLGKRRLRQLTNDNDTSLIRGIDNALIAYVEADMLQRERQYGKAGERKQEARDLLFQAINLHTYQTGSFSQVIPDDDGGYDGKHISGGYFLGKTYF